jgi:hypothetical protein
LRQALHSGFVAEYRAAADLRRRIDRKHGDAPAAFDQEQAEDLDEGRFADAGRPADTKADRPPGGGQQDSE